MSRRVSHVTLPFCCDLPHARELPHGDHRDVITRLLTVAVVVAMAVVRVGRVAPAQRHVPGMYSCC